MSLSREILDQLLSGYLDDSLSADERARIERLLETDPEVARELEELRGIRGWLKDVAKADSVVTLPEGFSDRVLDAAVASAKSEGLSDDHPLVRLAEQPSSQPAEEENDGEDFDPDTGPEIVSIDPKEIDPVKVPDQPSVDPLQPGITVPPREAIASTDPPKVGPEMGGVDNPDMLGGVMVLAVRMTAKGRESQAVKNGMLAAGIKAANEKRITDEIVGLAKETRFMRWRATR